MKKSILFLTLLIQEGTLDTDTDIDINAPDQSAQSLPGINPLSRIHDFTTEEKTIFRKPVRLTLEYTQPGDEDFPEDYINIYYLNREQNRWDIVPKQSQDMVNNTITVDLDHFSKYVCGTGSYVINENITPNTHHREWTGVYPEQYNRNPYRPDNIHHGSVQDL